MKLALALAGSLLASSVVWAQAATVAVFAASATDPNLSSPIATPVVYIAPLCNQPTLAEPATLVNVTQGGYVDPRNAARDCRIDLRAQMAALPVGTGYRAAVKLGTSPYGSFSTAFETTAAQPTPHPCDSTPTSPSSVNVNQSFTLGWCHSGDGGSPIMATRLYRNGTLVPSVTLTAGTTNAAGLRFYSVALTDTAPFLQVSFEATWVNAIGESARTAPITLTVIQPATVPAAGTRGRVTIP